MYDSPSTCRVARLPNEFLDVMGRCLSNRPIVEPMRVTDGATGGTRTSRARLSANLTGRRVVGVATS